MELDAAKDIDLVLETSVVEEADIHKAMGDSKQQIKTWNKRDWQEAREGASEKNFDEALSHRRKVLKSAELPVLNFYKKILERIARR